MEADLSAAGRASTLEAMAAEGVDVLVVGGGITGAGVALDAASRGLRVGLVEQADFASGTSSRSTKLVHGGIRYLPQFDFSLVREALVERRLLALNAPHLVRPLPFVIPFYRELRRPLGMRLPAAVRPAMPAATRAGLCLYDWLAGSGRLIPHRRLGLAEALHLVPFLRRQGLRRAYLYWDAQTDDARLTLAVLRTAARFGARCVNHVRAVGVLREAGRIRAVQLEDRLTGRRWSVPTRWVVNAAGVWAGEVAGLMAGQAPFRLTVSKGVHLVLPAELLGVERAALVLPETEDGRLAFVVPWEGRAVVGTTDSPYEGPLESPAVEEAEVEYLLRHVRRFLDVEVQSDDVLAAYAGLRPLVSGSGRSADLSRRHAVVLHEPGFVSVIGGKLTTYRRMAQDAVDVIARHEAREPGGLRIGPSRTQRLALVGAEHQERWAALVRQALKAGLAAAAAGRLVQTYGAEAGRLLELIRACPELGRPLAPGLPHLAAEVVFACETSMPVRLEDLMDRRLRIGLVAPAAAAAAATEAARLMGERLGWSGPRREEELQRYLGGLGRWREGIQPGCVEGMS